MVFKKKNYKLILSFILIVFIIGFKISINTEASTGTYSVYNLTESGKSIAFGTAKLTTPDFEKAKTEMKRYTNGVITSSGGLSPLKIVAATRGQAQSYPYRTGKDAAGATLNIYSNKALSSAHTYIPAHYMMYVYDYFLYNGRIIADIEIQGGRGYVEVNKIDVIPQIYIDKGIEIELGGNENYYSNKEQPYKIIPKQEKYTVEDKGSYKEIKVHVYRPSKNADFTQTYGIAPDFLVAGKNYYSPDGIRFFTDRSLKSSSRVGGDYYSYFQWLPVRSMTHHSKETFEKYLASRISKKSIMTGETHHFIEQGLKYGMNPLLIFHQANLESGHGTSSIAVSKNNLFGWGAVDSNPGNAEIYSAVGRGIQSHMSKQLAGYMNVDNWRHFGPSFGNKSAGISVKYASDPYYGIKIAGLCYQMDKEYGFKDLNAYNLSLLKDGTSYSVRKDASTNSEWYKTRSGLVNQVIVNLGKESNRIKTTLWMPNYEGKSYPGTFPLNLFAEFGYMDSSGMTNIQVYGSKNNNAPKAPKGWQPPKKELIYEKPAKAVVTASSLHLRESFSTSSASLGTIKNGTKLTVEKIAEPKNIPWARTTYNGKTGFVHIDYLEFEKVEVVYKKGDLNKDGIIDILDMMAIRFHILGIQKFNSEDSKNADLNNDGVIDILDMMAIRFHILGITPLK